GTPVANRPRVELEALVGFFVNTLALRLDFSGGPDVGALLAQVRDCVLQAQAHQDLPFEQVVEAVRPQRSLSHSPVFQLMFAWQNTPAQRPALGGLTVEPLASVSRGAKLDLVLDLEEGEGRVRGRIGYASALFDRATVQRHAQYLQALLRGMLRDEKGLPIEAIPLMDDDERRAQLRRGQGGLQPQRDSSCVHHRFERQVRLTPRALALQAGDQGLSYAELDARANRLARRLVELGVKPESRVAVVAERGIALVLGWLAVLKAGGAYVPLDPAHPQPRLAFLLDDCAPPVVLASAASRAGLPDCQALRQATVLDLDEAMAEPLQAQPAPPPEVALKGEHLAYVIYTSGSTGEPKGVMVEHRQLASLVDWHCER
ncbi:AMP-binding protein, partial [Pelomonas sp. CA6]|uniref:AMP-binding protein n=1 Tax=Pelomonas sp. CA6 TaxID=2907999 RepID=UPI001F4C2AFE